MNAPDYDLLPADFAAALREARGRTAPFGASVHYLQETGSTNDVAARLAERGAGEGTTVLASAQTAGRGRLGRTWFSPPGAGLYVSLVCRSRSAAPLLTLAGGIAVADGIRAATGLRVQIKWPNDIVIGSGSVSPWRRKVAGVLGEASTGTEGLLYAVLGFGINLRPAAYPPEIADRAASLEAELGRPVDAARLLIEILASFAQHYSALTAGERPALLERWRALAPSAVGSRVNWATDAGPCEGITAGVAEDGALLVRTASGTERIISGEVIWRR